MQKWHDLSGSSLNVYRKFRFFCGTCHENLLNVFIFPIKTPFPTSHGCHYWHDFWWTPFVWSYPLKPRKIKWMSLKVESWIYKGLGDPGKMWVMCTSWLSSFFSKSPAPWRWDICTCTYQSKLIFVSRRDLQIPTTLNLKFPISKNSVLTDQIFVSKNWQKSSKKENAGLHPAPSPYEVAPLPLVLHVWPQWCWITRTIHFDCGHEKYLQE